MGDAAMMRLAFARNIIWLWPLDFDLPRLRNLCSKFFWPRPSCAHYAGKQESKGCVCHLVALLAVNLFSRGPEIGTEQCSLEVCWVCLHLAGASVGKIHHLLVAGVTQRGEESLWHHRCRLCCRRGTPSRRCLLSLRLHVAI